MASASGGDQPFEDCANCGASFQPGVSYPVVTREGPDGELELYSFCDEDCRSAWADGD